MDASREGTPLDPKRRKQRKKVTSKQPTPAIITNTRYPWLPPRSYRKFNDNSEELFCICRKTDTGELMVGCDGCDDWFHFSCIHVPKIYSELIQSYYCPYCELEAKGKTMWKRKCRLDKCFKGIKGESKYCSEEHGVEYMKGLLVKMEQQKADSTVLNRAELAQIMHHTSGLDELSKLGQELPSAPIEIDDSRIRHIETSIISLTAKRNKEMSRRSVLLKAHENIKLLSDELSTGKKKKIALCGFEAMLTLGEDVTETSLLSNDIEKLKTLLIEESENVMDTLGDKICLLEKRKCQKHNGWQSMINDEIEMIIFNIDEQLEQLKNKRGKVVKTITVDYYEELNK
jgi:COMPASS component SPP1